MGLYRSHGTSAGAGAGVFCVGLVDVCAVRGDIWVGDVGAWRFCAECVFAGVCTCSPFLPSPSCARIHTVQSRSRRLEAKREAGTD